jgi:outer membrane protein assembly factor BamB
MASTIEALDPSNGTTLWKRQFSGQVVSGAQAADRLYLSFIENVTTSGTPGLPGAVPNGMLVALNAGTGVTSWQKTQNSGLLAPLGATSDAVLVNAVSAPSTSPFTAPTSAIEALRAGDGSLLWNVALPPGSLSSTATLGDGVLYLAVGSEMATAAGSTPPPAPTVLALDTGSGHALWHLALSSGASEVSGLVISGSVLYLSGLISPATGPESTPTSFILAIRSGDGTALWRSTPPASTVAGAVVVAGATVCYSYQELNTPGGGIAALHAADGTTAWRISLAGGGPAPLATSGGILYSGEQSKSVSGLDLTMRAYDASTGRSLFSRPLAGLPSPYLSFQAPSLFQVAGGAVDIVLGGPVALPTGPGAQPQFVSVVLSLSSSDGSPRWQHGTNGVAILMLVSP